MSLKVYSLNSKFDCLHMCLESLSKFSFFCTFAGDVTQAVSIFGFAFYVQPIMMPLLVEVPDGIVGVKIVSYSMRIVVLCEGSVPFVYCPLYVKSSKSLSGLDHSSYAESK